MENCVYWIWLTEKYGITSAKISALLDKFGTIDAIYKANNYSHIERITENDIKSLADKNLDGANDIYKKMSELDGYILTYDMEEYPDKLRNITPIPYILYVRGKHINLDEALTIGVIGSRHATDYGRLVTSRLAGELSAQGVILISGMARGLDAVASGQALKYNMPTVAVIGSGVDVVYPKENERLMYDIIKTGMVISEYPPGSEPRREHFPERNRIIAGLSNGVLVTQAKKGSGSLITARCAMEYGRDVFSVPGNILDPMYEGTNRLIQQGAKLVMSAGDIIEEYPYAKFTAMELKVAQPQKEAKPLIEDKAKPSGLSDIEEKIFDLLTQRDMSVDEMTQRLDISAQDMNIKMTMLEVRGVVEKMPGNIYKIKTS